jgi:hypothetical protein
MNQTRYHCATPLKKKPATWRAGNAANYAINWILY